MRYLLFGLIFCVSWNISSAQNGKNTLSSSADSDPQARAILQKMRDKYEGYSTMEVVFDLEMKFPEQALEKQKIQFKQKGDAYRVTIPGRTVISDGETIWMIMEKNEEVQINNVPEVAEDEGILSPESLFRMYERNDFAYYLVGQTTENGKAVQKIEFKPLDGYSDYSKLRLTVVKGSNEFMSVQAFGKDGARFTVTATSILPNANLSDQLFTFNKKDYEGYYIEDLRY